LWEHPHLAVLHDSRRHRLSSALFKKCCSIEFAIAHFQQKILKGDVRKRLLVSEKPFGKKLGEGGPTKRRQSLAGLNPSAHGGDHVHPGCLQHYHIRKTQLAVLIQMALTYADVAGAEPDAVKRSELLDLCMTCWRQAQLLRRWPSVARRR
jgi:hypothetical protein